MDFLSGLAKGGGDKPTSDEPNKSSDLFSNAKIVAEAAQAQFSNTPEKCDKSKAAAAAAEILDSAEKYGKLDEKTGVGKYVEQAEDYLRQYGSSGKPAAHAPAGEPAADKPAAACDPVPAATTHETEKPSEGGIGDYIKQAEGLLNKPEGDKSKPEESEGGGYGDLMKKAGGFFGK